MEPDPLELDTEYSELWKKRIATLAQAFNEFIRLPVFEPEKEKLSLDGFALDDAVNHYLSDLAVLKRRYKVKRKAQLHRVAGLLVAALMRYRPIRYLGTRDVPGSTGRWIAFVNESFAVHVGVAICGEYYASRGASIQSDVLAPHREALAHWHGSMTYLIGQRNFTSEALALVFETLCLWLFPGNFAFVDTEEDLPAGD
jgi:hypothetical protein